MWSVSLKKEIKKKSSITKNIGKQKLPFVNKDESKNSDKIYVFFYTFVEQEKQQQPKLWLKISNKKETPTFFYINCSRDNHFYSELKKRHIKA